MKLATWEVLLNSITVRVESFESVHPGHRLGFKMSFYTGVNSSATV